MRKIRRKIKTEVQEQAFQSSAAARDKWKLLLLLLRLLSLEFKFMNASVAPCMLYMPSLERLGYICYGDIKPQDLPLVLSV